MTETPPLRSEVRTDDLLAKLDGAWTEDHKTNLMHYCDLAGQEIRKLRKQLGEAHAETVQTQDELGALLHAAEARIPSVAQAMPTQKQIEAVIDDYLGNIDATYEDSRARCAQRIFGLYAVPSAQCAIAVCTCRPGPCLFPLAKASHNLTAANALNRALRDARLLLEANGYSVTSTNSETGQ